VRRILLIALVVLSPVTATAQERPPRDHWFGADKLKHFFMSAFIESLTFSGLQAIGANRNTAFAGAVSATAGFAVGKEFWDRRVTGLFSYRDLVWDTAGAGAGLLVLRNTRK
jgi:putative lipoprotein